LTCTGRRTERRTRHRTQVRSLVLAMVAYALWRMPTPFPSSAVFGHPLSSAHLRAVEDATTRSWTDRGLRSDDAPRRAPPSREPGCLSPSRTRRTREGCEPSGLRTDPLAHAAHTFSPTGESVLEGHCEVTVRSPAGSVTNSRSNSRVQTPLLLIWTRLGLTTQAHHRARPTRPSTRADCLARIDASRSA
jgi:hypothetical protein